MEMTSERQARHRSDPKAPGRRDAHVSPATWSSSRKLTWASMRRRVLPPSVGPTASNPLPPRQPPTPDLAPARSPRWGLGRIRRFAARRRRGRIHGHPVARSGASRSGIGQPSL